MLFSVYDKEERFGGWMRILSSEMEVFCKTGACVWLIQDVMGWKYACPRLKWRLKPKFDLNKQFPEIDLNPRKFLSIRFQMGKYNQSLEIFLKAESYLESPDHEVYHFIGELLCLNVKHSKSTAMDAKEYFKRSIMCGKQIQTYKVLARIYRKERDFPKAIELLEGCLRWVWMRSSFRKSIRKFKLKRVSRERWASNWFRSYVLENQRSGKSVWKAARSQFKNQ